jgi:PAS domain S-box-containing protein
MAEKPPGGNMPNVEDVDSSTQPLTRALLESEQRLALALEAANESIWEWNLLRGEAYFSPGFYAMLGYDNQEFPADHRSWIDHLHPDDLRRVTDDVLRQIASGAATIAAEYRLRHKAGEWRWLRSHGRVIRFSAQGRPELMAGTNLDITERKQTEQELLDTLEQQRRLNKRLEEAQSQLLQSEKMASIGQLAAGVAHELNNPIGFVHSNLGTLEKYLGDLFAIADAYAAAETQMLAAGLSLREIEVLKKEKDFDYLRKDIFQLLDESKDGLARLRKIVQDLKNFSHVDDAEWCWADLHKGLDSTLNIVWNELKYKCKVTKAYGQLPEVYCLPAQLNQVFMNLIVNAGQSIEDKGEIKIRTGVDEASSGEVWIEVSDTGKGIPKANLNRIFEPFYTTKPVGKGTGLGLSLSYSIVKKHQGRIAVDSVVGVGTTFRVTLPIQPAAFVLGGAEKA